MEKESILNSYKIFLKTCDFDIQILIQNKKENLLEYVNKIKNSVEKNNKKEIREISKRYINFIQKINLERNSLSKVFYIIIKETRSDNEELLIEEKIIKDNLKEKYLKVKECLARCGNYTEEIKNKEEIIKILNSFFYMKNYLNKLEKMEELL